MAGDPTVSLRTQILDAIKTEFETVRDGFDINWSFVTREPFQDGPPKGKTYCAGVYGPTESKSDEKTYPKLNATIACVLELYAYKAAGAGASALAEKLDQEAQRRLFIDQSFGGLAINVTVREITSDIDGQYPNYVSSAVFFDIMYQHAQSDPRRVV